MPTPGKGCGIQSARGFAAEGPLSPEYRKRGKANATVVDRAAMLIPVRRGTLTGQSGGAQQTGPAGDPER